MSATRQYSPQGHERRSLFKTVGSPLPAVRRLVMGMGSRFGNNRYVFSLAALAVLVAKVVHIGSHLSALPTFLLLRWGYTFFAQDFVLLIMLRLLLGGWNASASRGGEGFVRRLASVAASFFIAFVTTLNTIGICFFVVAGSEIHWRNVGVAGDAAGRALLLTGLVTSTLVFAALLLVAWILKDVLFVAVGLMADIVTWPFSLAARGLGASQPSSPSDAAYSKIPQQDIELGNRDDDDRPRKSFKLNEGWAGVKDWPWMWLFWLAAYTLACVGLLAQIVMCSLRPHESSLTFLSWTPALLPFIDFSNNSPNLEKLVPHYNSGINRDWDNLTTLQEPMPLPWLPKDTVLRGFEDWYDNQKTHYSAAADPLKISNLADDLLPELKKLKDVPIRHVITIVLESTRKDVFPFKHNNVNEVRLKESWEAGAMPGAALERLRTLTPVAKFLTGDHDDGFDHKGKEERKRGGLNFNDVFTTSTYTLKSITGTLCGITPLLADFNLEYLHHIYQPCLPHIFGALNTLDHKDQKDQKDQKDEKDAHGFSSYKWKSSYMQSVVMGFDKANELMQKIGFPKDGLIGSEYLRSKDAKFGQVNLPNVNYFGMQEEPLEDYIRDMFETAKTANERVFLTHLTSTSHHPYGMPSTEKYVPLGRGLDDLSHYINAIGYDDRWLGKILNMLDDMDVANETLIVLVGDHGLSIPENDILASYYNPNVASNHVPLVFSHPKLPPITINDSVSSQQILPTVLDLLAETGSLSSQATTAVRDLMANYEGQSLIRPVHKSKPADGSSSSNNNNNNNNTTGALEIANWHFTVINPGRAMVGIRDARRKHWRMVVPVLDNIEWHFSDVSKDPCDVEPTAGFDFTAFLLKIEGAHGEEAARWAEEAAFVARWWVEENSKRWRYGPYEA
ncbi:Iduronate 2-sulfatase [Colletotrichum trifolii]|uniref:Iduronate 2-sulfatase n=1 Tax=Colletotrichum trifolii TaxID=5466 RepID=A0A4R8QQ82_COLTR|nr:Iduronate 2-sulfatase [Colletotrichum trifolii]